MVCAIADRASRAVTDDRRRNARGHRTEHSLGTRGRPAARKGRVGSGEARTKGVGLLL
jgi:hypothetical protein